MVPLFLSPPPPSRVPSARAASSRPSSFLNPVTAAPGMGVSGAVGAVVGSSAAAVGPVVENAIGSLWGEAKHVGRRTIEVGGEAVAVATKPVAGAASDIGRGVSDMASFLAVAADNANSIAKKVLIGEAILAGLVLVGIGGAIYLSMSPRGERVTKIVLGRGGS